MRLRLTGSPGSQASQDIVVTLPDGTVGLAEILRAAGAHGFGEQVALDGRLVHVREPVGALPLHDGSAIDIHPAADPPGDHAVSLVEVAGRASGRIIPLPIGVHDIGRPGGPGRVETPVARIGVEHGGAVTLRSVGTHPVRLDGATVTGSVLEPLRPGIHLGTGDLLLRIAPGPAGPGGLGVGGSWPGARTFVAAHGTSGRVRYQRAPSATPGAAPPPPAPPDRAAPVRPAPPLSWAMVIAPIPMAVILAIVLNPRFLMFAAFSPMLALARWQEGRWRERTERRRAVAARARDLEGWTAALQAYAAQGSARLRARTPDLAALCRTAEQSGPGLWARRPGSAQFLCVAVGYGDLPATWELPRPGEADVDRIAESHRVVPDVPVILDLNQHPGAGFVSDDDPAGIAAGAIVQLAAMHGPADVQLALVCDPARLEHWDWLKWLPHLQDAGGSPRVATTPDAVAGIFESVAPAGSGSAGRRSMTARPPASGRTLVVVVDSAVLLDTVLGRLAACPERACVRLVVVGATPAQLPAVCTAVVSVSGGRLTLTDLAAPAQFRGALPVRAAPRAVEDLARALARYVDPEADGDGAGLPAQVDLGFLLGGVPDQAHLARWWAEHPGANLYATLGATDEGPLVVDLLADGPHMLVAGTTGAGKSELLRTLVASLACRYGPDRVNFVLVDFKGGGAFDACADLPHTVGVVTDLDDQLAARALRCLRAELRHREQVLRAAGAGDLAQLPPGPGTPARLVLVIDEFATLAAELPDFMGSLVDIAQRGRSLGIHLVLATQRPAGVVDAKIRANTNLRLSLRVQSEADSLDVIATTAAAGISRRTPGRGFARLGAAELRGFQTALVSTATPVHAVTTVRVDPFELAPDAVTAPAVRSASTSPQSSSPSRSPASGPDAPTDLRRIVTATAELAAAMPPARVPWPGPLPGFTPAGPLWDDADQRDDADPQDDAGPRDDAVLLGLTDRPDQQRIDHFHWTHRDSSLIAYGASTATTTGVIVTACAGLARRYPADALHVYLLDCVPGTGIERIAHLPHVAARVSPADHERLHRVVDLIDSELDRRREARTGGSGTWPLILLGIAGYHVLTSLAEEIGRPDLVTRIERIATEGPELGISTVLTTAHERGIPSRLASQIRSRLVFALADPNAYTSFGLRPRDVPNLLGNQAIDVSSGEQIVIATPADIACAGAGRGGPAPVRTLPEHIPLGELDHPSRIAGTSWHLALGVRHRDLTATGVDLPAGTHLVVSGPPASGRTTALRTLAESAVSAAASVRVLSSRPQEWDDVPALALDEPIAGPALIIVDGLDGAAGHDRVLDGMAGDPRVRIIVADRPDAFRMPPVWLRTVLGSRTGLLLQPQPDHGDLLRARLPMRAAVAHPAGRGYLVRGGLADLIQIAEP